MNNTGYRVTAHCRPKFSRGHNIRLANFVENQEHIDSKRSHYVLLDLGDEKECFEKIFGSAIENYNKNQKRKDRRLTSEQYLQNILTDERKGIHKNSKADGSRKTIYEFTFYIGNRDFHCDDKITKKVLDLFTTKIIPKKFPNIKPVLIAGHNDEYSFDRKRNRIESPYHIHFDFIYVAHALTPKERKEEYEIREMKKQEKKLELEEKGISWDEKKWKEKNWRKEMIERWGKSLETGLELQCSMSAACNEMGFWTTAKKGTAQQQFENAIMIELQDFAEEFGIKIDRSKGKKHKHLEKEDYIESRNEEELLNEITVRENILQAKELELQNAKDDFDYKIEHIEDMEQEQLQLLEANKKKKIELDVLEKLLNEKTKQKESELEEHEKSLNEKEKQLDDYKTNIDWKVQANFDKEKELDKREAFLREERENLYKREAFIKSGEAPLLEKKQKIENEIRQKMSDLQLNEVEIRHKEHKLDERQKSIEEQEKKNVKKESELNDLESRLNNQKIENERLEKSAKDYYDNANKEIEESHNEIERFNKEYDEKKKIIDEASEWELAAQKIHDSDEKLKNDFREFKQNRFSSSAIETLFANVKECVRSAVAKVKEQYEKIVKDLTRKLKGHSYEKNGRRYHSYGVEEISEMFLSADSTTFKNIAEDLDNSQSANFYELYQKQPKILGEYFEYARKMERSMERDIER